MEDVTITEMGGVLRVTLNTPEAKTLAIDEGEIAPYIHRENGLVFVDIKRTRLNRQNMVLICRKNHLTTKFEEDEY